MPSPVAALNRAVAVAKVAGSQPALALVDALAATGDLDSYHLLHATRADLLRRIGPAAAAARRTARRSSWRPMKANDGFSSGVCARFNRRSVTALAAPLPRNLNPGDSTLSHIATNKTEAARSSGRDCREASEFIELTPPRGSAKDGPRINIWLRTASPW